MDDTPKTLPENEVEPLSPSEDPAVQGSHLPDDADDTSDAGKPTTDHPAEGWRAKPLAKP